MLVFYKPVVSVAIGRLWFREGLDIFSALGGPSEVAGGLD